MVEILLGVSIIVNILFIWYIVQLLKRLLNISDNMEDFFDSLEEYNKHIETVYNLERFYGDTTLENLLRHSKNISEAANDFRAIYDVNYTPEEDEDREEDE